MLKLIHDNWALISSHSWLFITWTVVVGAIVWAGIHFLYKYRLEENSKEIKSLRQKISDLKEEFQANQTIANSATKSSEEYSYPDYGDHGPNILSPTVSKISITKRYSMAAFIPAGQKLRLQLVGMPQSEADKNEACWAYSVSVRNWQGKVYDQESHTQWFNAKSGDAELQFHPRVPGVVLVRIYETDSAVATREKIISVVMSDV